MIEAATLHGFVDESRRGQTYLLAMALVHVRDLDRTRSALRRMTKPGQRRIHFFKERDCRRREILAELSRLGIRTRVWVCKHNNDTAARTACLSAIAGELGCLGVTRFILESCRHQDDNDRRTLASCFGKAG